ncbi:hypothetical protein [Mesobacillus boroniphilus]|uniref:Diguanylate cyclase/phosphodiesterase n=1 Tax=Mesobacillus boroniphilus JCM 21738 TaxID=1294265 RepID=W4RJV9_9BACI|nr:hypothetical protein [Mesobacillus boroniphilus]GAE43869.1 diguanylate cyclase/phosphodiesterase [Mesobacillus boroniphilus JCM 21738]
MDSDGKIQRYTGLSIIFFLLFAELIDWLTSFYFPISEGVGYLIDLAVTIVFIALVFRVFKAVKNAAEDLEGHKKRLKSIFDTLDVAIWSHDLKTDTLLITSGIEKLYGHSSEEFYHDNTLWKKVIHLRICTF